MGKSKENERLKTFMDMVQPIMPLAYNYLNKEFHKKELVEDILQTALERAYKGFDSFRGDATFKSWFFKILTNVKNDIYKDLNKQKKVLSLSTVYPNNDENIAEIDWFNQNFNDDIEQIIIRDNIHRLLSYLPSEDRTLVDKIFVEDKSMKKISSELGQTEKNLRVRKMRVIEKLKLLFYIDQYEENLSHESKDVYVTFLKENLSRKEKILVIEILMNKKSFENLADATRTEENTLRIRYLRVLKKLSGFIRGKDNE